MTASKVVVVGGGIVGSFTGYFLKTLLKNIDVTVIERDMQYRSASTVLSAGGVRQQFSIKENILLSQLTLDILRHSDKYLDVDPSSMQFVEEGYCMLAGTEEGSKVLQENHALQTQLGANIQMCDPEQIKKRFPWMNCDDLIRGCVGLADEGWFDPWSLLSATRQKSTSMGVKYIQGDVIGLEKKDNKVHSIRYEAKGGEIKEIECDVAVAAAGAFSAKIAKFAGINDIPVEPRLRSIFAIHCPDTLDRASQYCPLVVDPTGVWFRRESRKGSGMFLCGLSPTVDDVSLDHQDHHDTLHAVLQSKTNHEFFSNEIWPVLANRSTDFENLKVVNAWTGLYEYNTFDQNCIIGAHPSVDNLLFCTGFSGHGLQQAAAAGRGISELIVHGKFKSLDLKCFGVDRILENRPFFEKNIV